MQCFYMQYCFLLPSYPNLTSSCCCGEFATALPVCLVRPGSPQQQHGASFCARVELGTHTGDLRALTKGLEVIDSKRIFSNRKFLIASSVKILILPLTPASAAFAQSLDRISCVAKTYASAGTD